MIRAPIAPLTATGSVRICADTPAATATRAVTTLRDAILGSR